MIFAIALASNFNRKYYFTFVYNKIQQLGIAQFSPIYLIPCRDGVGADYWNSACLLQCDLSLDDMMAYTKQWEIQAGRKRPSHKISLDVDIIAWGEDLEHMQFRAEKLPLAVDVKVPLATLWQHDALLCDKMSFDTVCWTDE